MGQSAVMLFCENPACGKEFIKLLTEFKRSEKLGRKHFCSLKCFAQANGLRNFKDKINRSTDHLKKGSDRDQFSPFRQHLKLIKKSSKQRNKEYSVTLKELKQLWEQQQGICPYTGWELELFPCTTDYERKNLTTRRASVDRKDSSKGYTLDNIQFIAVIANLAKNAFTETELMEFCEQVTRFRRLIIRDKVSYALFEREAISDDAKFIVKVETPLNLAIRSDEYSPFRQHLNLARKRVKSHGRECTITLQYLKELWEKQEGCCPYTGWELDNPRATHDWNGYRLHPKRASLDRLDSSFGYVPGNVQFVSVIANYAKSIFQQEELLEFCQAVAEYRQGNR
jgi:hypothetical protein